MSDMLQVAGEVFPSFNSTEGIAVDIYLSGCNRHPKCEGCHNPLLWDFNYGKTDTIDEVVNRLATKYADADSIAIMGGEPLNQPNLVPFLKRIKEVVIVKPIWLYTSYELSEVPEEVLMYVDYIKTGRFEENNRCSGWLASANQRIFQKVYDEQYERPPEFRLYYAHPPGKPALLRVG